MRSWSTACSTRPATASTWPGSGSTPPATATPTACTWTTTARSGPTATGSSRRSTPTSRSTSSSSSSSPATCCPTRRLDQLIATGFNRCHVSTSEGGSIEEEVYVRNVVDQVDTNGTVFLGLTVGCARCHDHKYDPVRTKDYYQLFAFFNNIDGPALDGNAAQWAPIVKVPTRRADGRARGRRREDRRAAPGDRRRGQPRPSRPTTPRPTPSQGEVVQRADFVWLDDALPPGASPQGDGPWEFVDRARPSGPQRPGLVADHRPGAQAAVLRERRAEAQGRRGRHAVRLRLHRPAQAPQGDHAPVAHRRAWSAPGLLGRERDRLGQGRHARAAADRRPAGHRASGSGSRSRRRSSGSKPGTVIDGWAFTQHDGTVYWDRAGIETWTPQDGQTLRLAHRLDPGPHGRRRRRAARQPQGDRRSKPRRSAPRHRAKELLACVRRARLDAGPRRSSTRSTRSSPRPRRSGSEVDDAIPTTLVFRERKGEPKPAFILNRGEYDQRRDKVGRATPGVPAAAAAGRPGRPPGPGPVAGRPEPPADGPRGGQPVLAPGLRHGDRQDGRGLRLAGRAAQPSRAARLAGRAVPRGRLGREAVHEAAGDVGDLPPELAASTPGEPGQGPGQPPALPRAAVPARRRDPARPGPLRSAACWSSSVGGPSVKPPQPPGCGRRSATPAATRPSSRPTPGAEKVHRRSLYTFWKRTSPPPQMTTLRRPLARGLHGPPRADQHAAPGPLAA